MRVGVLKQWHSSPLALRKRRKKSLSLILESSSRFAISFLVQSHLYGPHFLIYFHSRLILPRFTMHPFSTPLLRSELSHLLFVSFICEIILCICSQVYCTHTAPDYSLPWQKQRQFTSTGRQARFHSIIQSLVNQ